MVLRPRARHSLFCELALPILYDRKSGSFDAVSLVIDAAFLFQFWKAPNSVVLPQLKICSSCALPKSRSSNGIGCLFEVGAATAPACASIGSRCLDIAEYRRVASRRFGIIFKFREKSQIANCKKQILLQFNFLQFDRAGLARGEVPLLPLVFSTRRRARRDGVRRAKVSTSPDNRIARRSSDCP